MYFLKLATLLHLFRKSHVTLAVIFSGPQFLLLLNEELRFSIYFYTYLSICLLVCLSVQGLTLQPMLTSDSAALLCRIVMTG